MAYRDEVLADNPLAYWHLSEGSGASLADDSGHSHTATLHGGYTLGHNPGGGLPAGETSLLLNGSSGYADAPDGSGALCPASSAFTIEAWVYLSSAGAGNTARRLIASKPLLDSEAFFQDPFFGPWGVWALGYGGTGSDYQLFMSVATSRGLRNSFSAGSGYTIATLDKWHHIVGVFDGVNGQFFKLYFDGALSLNGGPADPGHTSILQTGDRTVQPALIGKYHWSTQDGDYLDNPVSQVAIYDHVLAADRVAAHYLAGVPLGAPPTLNPFTSVSSAGFTAHWSAVAGAASYRVDVAEDAGFAAYVPGYQDLDVGNVLSLRIDAPPLTPGDHYWVRVRAHNAGGSGGHSNVRDVVLVHYAVYDGMLLSHGPSAYWRLGDDITTSSGARLIDSSGHGHHAFLDTAGSAAFTPQLGVEGAIAGDTDTACHMTGQGGPFSGHGRLEVPPRTAPYLGMAPRTFELWYRQTGNFGGSNPLLFMGDRNTSGACLAVNIRAGELVMGTRGWDTPGYGVGENTNWHHVVAVVDSYTFRIYYDGVQRAAVNYPGDLRLTDERWYLGAGYTWSGFGLTATYGELNGDLDEVAIYDYALPAWAVADHYAQAPGTSGSAPDAPVAREAGHISGGGFQANWHPCRYATSYRLDVSTSPSFGSFVSGYADRPAAGPGLKVEGLTPGTTYYYRVRARSASGTSGSSATILVYAPLPSPTPPIDPGAEGLLFVDSFGVVRELPADPGPSRRWEICRAYMGYLPAGAPFGDPTLYCRGPSILPDNTLDGAGQHAAKELPPLDEYIVGFNAVTYNPSWSVGLAAFADESGVQVHLVADLDGRLTIYRGAGFADPIGTTWQAPFKSNYGPGNYVEWRVKIGEADGSVELRVGKRTRFKAEGIDTRGSGATISRLYLGMYQTPGAVPEGQICGLSGLYISNTLGGAGFVGPMRVDVLRPSGRGSSSLGAASLTQWGRTLDKGLDENWRAVNDYAPGHVGGSEDESGCVVAYNAGALDTYAHDTFAAATALVAVQSTLLTSGDPGQTLDVVPLLRVSGVDHDAAPHTPAEDPDGRGVARIWPLAPGGGAPWTPTLVNAAEGGERSE
jgi:hypothetical protein